MTTQRLVAMIAELVAIAALMLGGWWTWPKDGGPPPWMRRQQPVVKTASCVSTSIERRCEKRRMDTGGPMMTHFPQAVPEIPVSNVDKAAEYYVNVLGFSFDWGNDNGGIGGISQGDCRMFLSNAPFRAVHGPKGPVIVWLNLNSKQQVDELFERWKDSGATIIEAVDDKPWNLREFRVADLDGNQLRVFYDFNWEMRGDRRA